MAKFDRIGQNRNNLGKSDNDYLVEPAEVVDIIMSSDHPKYQVPSDIGAIVFRRLYSDYKKLNKQLNVAHMMDGYFKEYPIIHEVVTIYKSLTPISVIQDKSVGFYYKTITNAWGLSNHNALPYSTQSVNTENNQQLSDFTGNNVTDQTDVILGEYFNENVKIPSLLPFEGDVIYNGRFGNSIRLSSITKKDINNWSDKGEVGEPIIIIRNDKQINSNSHIVEDINKDNNSIYLTDGQSIDFKPDSLLQKSFIKSDKPIQNRKYLDSQIFLTANRININAKSDSILLSSKITTHISSDVSINLDASDYISLNTKEVTIKTDKYHLDSGEIYFGKNATTKREPIVLGTQLLNAIDEILTEMLIMIFATGVGPTSPMLPPSSVKLLALKTRLSATKFILSKISYAQ